MQVPSHYDLRARKPAFHLLRACQLHSHIQTQTCTYKYTFVVVSLLPETEACLRDRISVLGWDTRRSGQSCLADRVLAPPPESIHQRRHGTPRTPPLLPIHSTTQLKENSEAPNVCRAVRPHTGAAHFIRTPLLPMLYKAPRMRSPSVRAESWTCVLRQLTELLT